MDELRLATGRAHDGATIPQALWYFADETIATPRAGVRTAGFARNVGAWDDIRQWAAAHPLDAKLDAPPLIWIGAPQILRGAALSADGGTLVSGSHRWSFVVVPKIPLNRSYYDRTSIAFFARHRLAVRGSAGDGTFVARTLWPEEFRLDATARTQTIAPAPAALRDLIRAEPRGGAQSPFSAAVLWERTPGAARRWDRSPVLALILNGAQGDDDEAHAGHFALVTGYVGPNGAIGDWITNNFYTLDAESEKGILPAMVPLDNYLGDLNSGQAWYRPSYLIAAVLKRERIAARVQGALERTYNQFYRHQLLYRHTTMNCASISVDVLRALGLGVRARGATSWLAAALGLPYFAVHDRSVAKAAQAFDYLTEDRTRLMPAAAFEEIGAALLRIAGGSLPRSPSPMEAALAEDLEAIVYLSLPQFPSSRAWGDFPVVTAWEYRKRYPRDPAKAKIIPVPPRPFPEALRADDLLPPPRPRSDAAVILWAIISIVGIPWILWRWWQRAKVAGSRSAVATPASGGAHDEPSGRRDAPTPQ
ncbi:MAG TPA: hypothetical protein VFF44_03025 [Casimicrobiaceae bacterium]|nr:hypothetical protein [Casimicrobiaceae bacterium]